MEHKSIIRILACKGFNEHWLNIVEAILSSGTSSILLKGVPGKKFPCRRGVRQGNPFSPLLFVSDADLLQLW
jgi:hypothetical protein